MRHVRRLDKRMLGGPNMTPPLASAYTLIDNIPDLTLMLRMLDTYIDIVTLPCTELEATK